MKYVVLLRGINVGNGARVSMKDLKALLEALGLSEAITYLNSGNVVFCTSLSVPDLTRAYLFSEINPTTLCVAGYLTDVRRLPL